MTAVHTCKWSIYDPNGLTQSCALPLGHTGPHQGSPYNHQPGRLSLESRGDRARKDTV